MAIPLFRISVLIVLSVVAFIGIFSELLDDSATWFADFFLSKGIGALAIYAIYKLYPRWSKTDKWIAAYDKWSEKGLEED